MRRVQRGGAYFRIADPNWTDPLDASYSIARGGRWNPAGSFPVLYLNRDLHTSRANLKRKFAGLPYGPELLKPEEAPLLAETTVVDADYVDIVSDAGCAEVGLPITYPVDAQGHEVDRGRCQQIGLGAWQAGERGIACRSAATHDRTGEELALFRREGESPLVVNRRLTLWEWFQ